LVGAGFVGGSKKAFDPIPLNANRINLNAFQKGTRDVKIVIQLATGLNGEKRISHETIRANLRRLSKCAAAAAPPLSIQFLTPPKKQKTKHTIVNKAKTLSHYLSTI
jgi:hypothetical protein